MRPWKEDIISVALGMLVGASWGSIVSYYFLRGDGREELNNCEKSLPRDQVCVLIAVPEKTYAHRPE